MRTMKKILVACLCVIFLAGPSLAGGDKDLEDLLQAGAPKEAIEVVRGAGWHLTLHLVHSTFSFPLLISTWQHKVNKTVYVFTLLPAISDRREFLRSAPLHKNTLLEVNWYIEGRAFSWSNKALLEKIYQELQKKQERPTEIEPTRREARI